MTSSQDSQALNQSCILVQHRLMTEPPAPVGPSPASALSPPAWSQGVGLSLPWLLKPVGVFEHETPSRCLHFCEPQQAGLDYLDRFPRRAE